MSGSGPTLPDDERHSSFRLEISLAVGYQRKRTVLGGEFEGHLVTLILLLAGVLVVGLFVLGVLHVFQALPF